MKSPETQGLDDDALNAEQGLVPVSTLQSSKGAQKDPTARRSGKSTFQLNFTEK